ncbi:MAG TPA: alpha/beta hydrolase [Blastocatellia bacterium]|nr:alpha/beta hydrolase [Blastocatellia bacterium]
MNAKKDVVGKGTVNFPVGSADVCYTSVNGLRIAYYDSRPMSRTDSDHCTEPVILVHGFCSMSYTWNEVFDQIAAHRRVIAIDLKGFGASDKPADNDYLIDSQAGIVMGMMDVLGIERAALVGCSLGGAAVLRVAQNRPQRVTGLVLVNPAACHFDKFPLLARLVLAANRVVSQDFALRVINRLANRPGLIESRLRNAHYSPSTVTPERVAHYSSMLRDSQCQRAIIATLRTFDLRPIERNLSAVNHPTLVIHGAHDRVVPPGVGEQLARTLPRAEMKMLPCGHAPQEEMPAEFVTLVNEFLKSTDSGRPAYQTSLAM